MLDCNFIPDLAEAPRVPIIVITKTNHLITGTDRATPSSRLATKLIETASKSAMLTIAIIRKRSGREVYCHSILCEPAIRKATQSVANEIAA